MLVIARWTTPDDERPDKIYGQNQQVGVIVGSNLMEKANLG